jgi:HD-GYP domain-containing protein (c-di-GMP phosphodiesterase class II)
VNERLPAGFLKTLRRLVRQVGLFPPGHPLTDEATMATLQAADDLMATDGEVVITVLDNAFYHNRTMLPHTSLEYHVLMREMQARSVESIKLVRPVSAQDLIDVASFIGGTSDDLPVDGTVLLNEVFLTPGDMEAASSMDPLRASYRGSLDALRVVTGTMASQGTFELSGVVEAVEGLFETSVSHGNASLLLSTVKSHDEYTFFHSVNACILALAVGRMIGVDKEQLIPVGVGAVLHDIGKVAVSTAVLNYPGRLSDGQWKEITIHPQEGALAIMAAGGRGSEIAATVAFEHHARYDGTGYPRVTRDGRPHVFSRVVSIADTYDAITTRRSYRRAETPHRSLQILLSAAGAHYDPDLVRVFIRMMGLYPPGSILERTDGSVVVVTAPAEDVGAPIDALLVRDTAQVEIDAEPVVVDPGTVVGQLLPQAVGIDPASLLERLAETGSA